MSRIDHEFLFFILDLNNFYHSLFLFLNIEMMFLWVTTDGG